MELTIIRSLKHSLASSKYSVVLLVALCYLGAEFFVNPSGEFPLNDDWAYTKAIKYFLHTGELKFSSLIAIPFVSQFLIGVSVCKVFGFSFFALRMISIFATVGMLFVLDKLLIHFSFKKRFRFILLLTFIFNPLVFSIGNTFLPDTLIVFFALISFNFMLLFFKNNHKKELILFIFFTLLGTLNRQTGVLIPLIFTFLYLYSAKWSIKNGLIAFTPLFFNVSALVVFQKVASAHELLPTNYNMQLDRLIQYFQLHPLNSSLLIGCYLLTSLSTLGILILPLVISNYKQHIDNVVSSKKTLFIFVLTLCLYFYKTFFTVWYMPFIGNIFYPIGSGPIIMTGFNSDALILSGYNISFSVRLVYIALSFVGGASFFFVANSILLKMRMNIKDHETNVCIFFTFLLIMYLGMITLNYPNDRYLLFLIPFFYCSYLVAVDFKWNPFLFGFSFLFLFLFTVTTNHDYFSINRARWKAIKHLKSDLKIDNDRIDGGLEFNYFYLEGRTDYQKPDSNAIEKTLVVDCQG
jgi:hypothetical protein